MNEAETIESFSSWETKSFFFDLDFKRYTQKSHHQQKRVQVLHYSPWKCTSRIPPCLIAAAPLNSPAVFGVIPKEAPFSRGTQ